jgi:hypothetical protein
MLWVMVQSGALDPFGGGDPRVWYFCNLIGRELMSTDRLVDLSEVSEILTANMLDLP